MKMGPLALPVANTKELIGFALLVIATIYAARMLKSAVPASVQQYLP
jgi:hypothetical protein